MHLTLLQTNDSVVRTSAAVTILCGVTPAPPTPTTIAPPNRGLCTMTEPFGGAVTTLLGTAAGDTAPDVSPDGRFIALQAAAGIFRVNADGTGSRATLTGTAAGDTRPRVSPDGTKVFFSRPGAGIGFLPWPNGGSFTLLTGTVAGDIQRSSRPTVCSSGSRAPAVRDS